MMAAGRQRLDRFIAQRLNTGRSDTRVLLAQKRLLVDGQPASSVDQIIDHFSFIQLDGKTLQQNTAQYIMLNKPCGVVSATNDEKHQTIIDLLDTPDKHHLHIVGRLDFNSTGLLLLTNDSRWSEQLMHPDHKVKKHYIVTVDKPITDEMITAFDSGIYLAYEGITTQKAMLKKLAEDKAEVILTEGKYHQIKRMLGHFDCEVLTLHRTRIGQLTLDTKLERGQYRALTMQEVKTINA